MNVIGAVVCLIILGFIFIVVRRLWPQKKERLICRISLFLALIGAVLLFGSMAIALFLGVAGEQGTFTNIQGVSMLVGIAGVFFGSMSGCGQSRK